jgi:hypothetical protein
VAAALAGPAGLDAVVVGVFVAVVMAVGTVRQHGWLAARLPAADTRQLNQSCSRTPN